MQNKMKRENNKIACYNDVTINKLCIVYELIDFLREIKKIIICNSLMENKNSISYFGILQSERVKKLIANTQLT